MKNKISINQHMTNITLNSIILQVDRHPILKENVMQDVAWTYYMPPKNDPIYSENNSLIGQHKNDNLNGISKQPIGWHTHALWISYMGSGMKILSIYHKTTP